MSQDNEKMTNCFFVGCGPICPPSS